MYTVPFAVCTFNCPSICLYHISDRRNSVDSSPTSIQFLSFNCFLFLNLSGLVSLSAFVCEVGVFLLDLMGRKVGNTRGWLRWFIEDKVSRKRKTATMHSFLTFCVDVERNTKPGLI